MISSIIRNTAEFGRWGGEEFIIILPNTKLEDAIVLAEKLRTRIEKIDINEIEGVTASFGVTSFCGNEAMDLLISRADKCMYKAKIEGRNRVNYQME